METPERCLAILVKERFFSMAMSRENNIVVLAEKVEMEVEHWVAA